jgi:hypothetical protein
MTPSHTLQNPILLVLLVLELVLLFLLLLSTRTCRPSLLGDQRLPQHLFGKLYGLAMLQTT